MYDLTGKSIIITGAGSGMGREAALLAAKAGAHITVADIVEASGNETVDLVRSGGGEAQFVKVDIAVEADTKAMVDAAISAFGKLDAAFNNAAISQVSKPFHDLTEADLQRIMGINVIGTFFCMKHEIIAMRASGGGAIVNTSSAGGVVAFPFAGEYVASKHAVVGLTKAAALEYGTAGIRVNALLPGATLTPMLKGAFAQDAGLEQYLIDQEPIGRLAEPAEMATAAVWLLSAHASFVTGACIPVDGGYTAK
jgi:2,5-dichloro-2,5-cyclohexadiene-1,4-diol dehydrogenase 1